MNPSRWLLGAVTFPLVLSGGQTKASVCGVLDRLWESLLERQVQVADSNRVCRMAVEGAIRALDPRGRLLTAGEMPFSMERGAVEAQEAWEEGLCYVRIRGVLPGVGTELAETLSIWNREGKFGLILDLRGATGDSLQTVDRIATALGATEGVLYYVRDTQGMEREVHSSSAASSPWAGKPAIVLVDETTSDAAELLAAVLRKIPNVMLVGRSTLGDWSVRELLPIAEGLTAYVATGSISFPGEDERRGGVVPHLVVEPATTKGVPTRLEPGRSRWRRYEGKPTPREEAERRIEARVGADAALRRAADILLGLKALECEEADSGPATSRGERPTEL